MADSSTTMTLNEAAEHLGVHYMTAYRYVRLGKLAAAQGGQHLEGGCSRRRSAPRPASEVPVSARRSAPTGALGSRTASWPATRAGRGR